MCTRIDGDTVLETPIKSCADINADGENVAFDCESAGGDLSRPIAGAGACDGECDADECCGMSIMII